MCHLPRSLGLGCPLHALHISPHSTKCQQQHNHEKRNEPQNGTRDQSGRSMEPLTCKSTPCLTGQNRLHNISDKCIVGKLSNKLRLSVKSLCTSGTIVSTVD